MSDHRSPEVREAMKRDYYEFFDEFLLEVRGGGDRTTKQVRKMYDYFSVSVPDRAPDVVVERTTDGIDPDVVLGDPDDYYGWTGDRFVVNSGGDYMATTPGWEHITVTADWEPFYVIYPIEYALRRRAVDQGMALIHASGLRFGGQTTLFPAWRGAGKTNTLLTLLSEGAEYLSDDRLWVSDGSARGYPLAMNLQPYNLESFPEIELTYETAKKRARHDLNRYLDERLDPGRSLAEKVITYIKQSYLESPHRHMDGIDTLFPGAAFLEESSVDNVVFLQAAPKARTVTTEPISTETALSSASAISFFEWDRRLREYLSAYDALVPGGAAVETHDRIVEAERDIFRTLFDDVETYRARVPRETDWKEEGIDKAILEMVSSLSETTPQKLAPMDGV